MALLCLLSQLCLQQLLPCSHHLSLRYEPKTSSSEQNTSWISHLRAVMQSRCKLLCIALYPYADEKHFKSEFKMYSQLLLIVQDSLLFFSSALLVSSEKWFLVTEANLGDSCKFYDLLTLFLLEMSQQMTDIAKNIQSAFMSEMFKPQLTCLPFLL